MVVPRPHKTIVEYRIYELEPSFPVLLLDGEDWHISDVKSNRLHFHNYFEVGVCHTDGGTMTFEDVECPFRAGDVTCIPKYTAHTTCSSIGAKSLWSYLYVDFEKMALDARAIKKQSVNFYQLFSRSDYPRIYFYAMSIIEEMRQKKGGYEMIVRSLFQAMYYELLRIQDNCSAPRPGNASTSYALAPALEYIRNSYMERFSIEELAAMCHLSETHFRREFLSIIGSTPLNFINAMRVEKACDLLDATSDSILAVSEAVGFSSLSSFSRCFLQIMGVSPKSYRNRAAADGLKPKDTCILPYRGWTKAEDPPEA
ncbi:MAG: AraC family transcriptional regulator [Clostridiales bacterium]|nr:AraC family transcriptional regulator [Clostridiales bacterium]